MVLKVMTDSSSTPLDTGKATKLVSVGVDFGTSFSGFAFAFIHKDNHQSDVVVETKWDDAPSPYCKTLSDMLLDSDQICDSWGYSAMGNFVEHMEDGDAKDYKYVRYYKMSLLNTSKSHDGMDVCELIKQYLMKMKEKILQNLSHISTRKITEQDIKWVFTVPALWGKEDIQVMKSIIIDAQYVQEQDPSENDLMIAYEPEAAAVFCINQLKKEQHFLKEGTNIIIVDAGGGTVDITGHKIEKGKLREKAVRTAGKLGSSILDSNFLDMLKKKFGSEVVEEFKEKDCVGYMELMFRWEQTKTAIKDYNDSSKRIEIGTLKQFLNPDCYPKQYSHINNKLKLEQEDIEFIFKNAIDGILSLLKTQIVAMKRAGCKPDLIFLVGGFGQNEILRKSISENFETKNCKLIYSKWAGQAVVAGAALLGIDPSLIRTRKSDRTYGIGVNKEVNAETYGLYSKEKLDYNKETDTYYVKDFFKSFVGVDEEIGSDEERTYSFDIFPNQSSLEVKLYSTIKKATYVDDEDVKDVGDMTFKINPLPVMSKLIVKMKFGKANVLVEAEIEGGEKQDVQIVFKTK